MEEVQVVGARRTMGGEYNNSQIAVSWKRIAMRPDRRAVDSPGVLIRPLNEGDLKEIEDEFLLGC